MIRITCPGCGSKLGAKQELAGQTRTCPKCGTAVEIPLRPPAAPAASQTHAGKQAKAHQHVQAATEDSLPAHHWPERLDRNHHYLICGRSKLVAAWQNNGEGWMLKTNAGLISASRNRDQIPSQGDFKLVELKLETMETGRRLVGIVSYQLAARWALTSLDKGDDAIASKITGLGSLNKEQKGAVRSAIKELFMHQIWEHADRVFEYLDNTDYHSPGTG